MLISTSLDLCLTIFSLYYTLEGLSGSQYAGTSIFRYVPVCGCVWIGVFVYGGNRGDPTPIHTRNRGARTNRGALRVGIQSETSISCQMMTSQHVLSKIATTPRLQLKKTGGLYTKLYDKIQLLLTSTEKTGVVAPL